MISRPQWRREPRTRTQRSRGDEGGFLNASKHFAELRPRVAADSRSRSHSVGAFCVWLFAFQVRARLGAERSKLIHTLPIHCWTTRRRTYICKLFLTNKTQLRTPAPALYGLHGRHISASSLGTNNSSCSTNKRRQRHPSWTTRQY